MELQRELAARQSLILDGRDIGTYVLPNATVKFFITASPEVRARRRYEEMQAKGDNGVYEDVLQEMIQRDHNDSNRALAPTKQAEDAILIDTDGRSIAELIEEMLAVIEQKINDNNDDTE